MSDPLGIIEDPLTRFSQSLDSKYANINPDTRWSFQFIENLKLCVFDNARSDTESYNKSTLYSCFQS